MSFVTVNYGVRGCARASARASVKVLWRFFATGSGSGAGSEPDTGSSSSSATHLSPLQRYDLNVAKGLLREDAHQRHTIATLNSLYEELLAYSPPKVAIPDVASLKHLSLSSPLAGIKGWLGKWSKERGGATSGATSATAHSPDGASRLATPPHGIYLYGDVGCGKTMLMDLFYATVPPHLPKKRLHFHQFMQQLHRRSHQLKMRHGTIDVIPILALELLQEATILCFDEFQVTDVADAMLLRRLLSAVLRPEFGLILFATSNRAPGELYINGIQRESFVPCIRLIEEKTSVIFLDSPLDYRKLSKAGAGVYYWPGKAGSVSGPGSVSDSNSGSVSNSGSGKESGKAGSGKESEPGSESKSESESVSDFNTESTTLSKLSSLSYNSPQCTALRNAHIQYWFNKFSQNTPPQSDVQLEIWGRHLRVPLSAPPKVAQFSFHELCAQELALGDYLTLATSFEAFVVTDIPYLSVNLRDQVRRFITFLDAVYDAHGRLAVTAAAPFSDIFVEPEDLLDPFTLKPEAKVESLQVAEADADLEPDEMATKHHMDPKMAKKLAMFGKLDEERFAFARLLSRLSHMSSSEWVERE